ncbi:MAG: hypothetical protein HZA88_03000 [Verrucomicrobia bacterium]|nr:hypothetical protein [Verrucomicrobiota bacterium]
MKRVLLLLLFIAAICVNAAEVRVTLKDGSNVSGILVWQNDKQMGIATSKDGRASMRSVDKKDVVDIADLTAEREAEIARIKAITVESAKRTEETKKLMELMEKERKKTGSLPNGFIRESEIELKLKDGSRISGLFVSQDDRVISLRAWDADHCVQKTINKADIVEFVDHRAEQRLAIARQTKERIEKDITAAEEEVRRRQENVPKAQNLMDSFLRQRRANPESLKQRKESDQKENELRVQLKGAQIAANTAKAKVEALRNELEFVNRDLSRLEKQRGFVK